MKHSLSAAMLEVDPTVSDELMMTVMYGASNEAQSFSSHVGSGFNKHCLEGAALINDTTVYASTISKLSITTCNILKMWEV